MNIHYETAWGILKEYLLRSASERNDSIAPLYIFAQVFLETVEKVEKECRIVDANYITSHFDTYKSQIRYYQQKGDLPKVKGLKQPRYLLRDVLRWAEEMGMENKTK